MATRQLNTKQVDTLNTVLKFRYVTTDNLAKNRNITNNSAYSALEILRKAGYLGKLHDKSYRLQNKSARYYLSQQAIDYLRKASGAKADEQVWKSRRREASKSPDFIDLQVAIHTAYIELRDKLGEDAAILTAADMQNIEGIIKPLPNLLVRLKTGKQFFVELTDDQHLFLAKKRIRKYIQNYDDNEWEWEKYPDMYIVRAHSATDRIKLRSYATEKVDDAYLDEQDFSFYVLRRVDQIK